MPNLRVYVLKEPSSIAVGSAVVGQPTDRKRVRIDYEGDIYGRGRSFGERLAHAASRHVAEYPTVARLWLEPDALIPVGWYEADSDDLVVDDHRAAEVLAWWLGAEAERCEARLPEGEARPLVELGAAHGRCRTALDRDGDPVEPAASRHGDSPGGGGVR